MEVRERILRRVRNIIGIRREGGVSGREIGVIGGRNRYGRRGSVRGGGNGTERRRISGGGVLIVLVVIG